MNISEVKKTLKSLGFDDRFNTEQTAICVLSLLDNHPKLLRIHDIIVHAKQLGKKYAENTRESIRKASLKRLVNHGLIIFNKDDPQRPTNSGLANYCLTADFYSILTSNLKSRKQLIESWNKLHETMAAQVEDVTHKVSVKFPDGKTYTLSPGLHNLLEKYIVEKLVPTKIKKPEIVYLGDTKNKMLYVNHGLVKKLGIILDEHDKLPDVIVWSHALHKFHVIESVTSVGPVEESRRKEIDQVINKKSGKKYDIVYTTAFLDRKTFARFAGIIAADTFVWIASEPDGVIHYSRTCIDL